MCPARRFRWSQPLVPECQHGFTRVSVLASCCAPSGNDDAIKQSTVSSKPCRADTQKLSNLGSSKERHCAATKSLILFHVMVHQRVHAKIHATLARLAQTQMQFSCWGFVSKTVTDFT